MLRLADSVLIQAGSLPVNAVRFSSTKLAITYRVKAPTRGRGVLDVRIFLAGRSREKPTFPKQKVMDEVYFAYTRWHYITQAFAC